MALVLCTHMKSNTPLLGFQLHQLPRQQKLNPHLRYQHSNAFALECWNPPHSSLDSLLESPDTARSPWLSPPQWQERPQCPHSWIPSATLLEKT